MSGRCASVWPRWGTRVCQLVKDDGVAEAVELLFQRLFLADEGSRRHDVLGPDQKGRSVSRPRLRQNMTLSHGFKSGLCIGTCQVTMPPGHFNMREHTLCLPLLPASILAFLGPSDAQRRKPSPFPSPSPLHDPPITPCRADLLP